MRLILLLLGCFLLSLVVALDRSIANPRNLGECINAHHLLFEEIKALMPMAPPEDQRAPDQRIFPFSGYQNTFHHCLASLRSVQAGAATLREIISRTSQYGRTPGPPNTRSEPIREHIDTSKSQAKLTRNQQPYAIDGCTAPWLLLYLHRPPRFPLGLIPPLGSEEWGAPTGSFLSPLKNVQDPVGGKAGLAPSMFGKPQGLISSAAEALKLPCNQHDICYQTCGSNQQACDIEMKRSMDQVCMNAYPTEECPHKNSPMYCADYRKERVFCMYWAWLYKRGLDEFGTNIWMERQEQYCKDKNKLKQSLNDCNFQEYGYFCPPGTYVKPR